jgi:hypothetical protein
MASGHQNNILHAFNAQPERLDENKPTVDMFQHPSTEFSLSDGVLTPGPDWKG